MTDLIQQLNWRYATKEFDPTKKLTDEQWAQVLEALRLSASSFGLQPYKFVVVENPKLRAKLREASYGQPQVTDASHFIVFCRTEKIDEAYIDKFIALNAQTRGVDLASLDGFKKMLYGFSVGMDEAGFAVWAEKQIYLAVGNLLTSCAVLGIDATPMEGLSSAQYDEILGLPAQGLHASTVAVAVGMRSSTDSLAGMKKVRFSKEDLVVTIK